MSINRECSSFLGVYIAETVLSDVFKNVKRMDNNNPGFDFICNKNYKIDVKSSCRRISVYNTYRWSFHINRNKIPDYFLLIGFNNREDLSPEYLWCIPGHVINNFGDVSISESTITKWNTYKLPIDGVIEICDELRG